MSALPLINARIFAGGLDATGTANKVALSNDNDDLDTTTFASGGYRTRIAGLGDSTVSVSGFWDAGDATKPDDRLFADLATPQPFSAGPVGANVGDLAYVVNMLEASYMFGGAVGDVLPYSADGKGTGAVARGVFLHDPGTARTANGSGTGVLWIAVPSGSSVIAALHVLSVAGTAAPSLTVNVQSSAAVGFASPTTQLSFAAATAPSGQVLRLAGPVTDTYWRVTYGITGTAPSFMFVATIGVSTP